MEVKHKLKLKRNTEMFLCDLDAKDVLAHLFEEGIITENASDEIMAAEPRTRHKRTTELLRRLPKCGPKAYEVFCSALDKCGHTALRKALDDTEITEEDVAGFNSSESCDQVGTEVFIEQISQGNTNSGFLAGCQIVKAASDKHGCSTTRNTFDQTEMTEGDFSGSELHHENGAVRSIRQVSQGNTNIGVGAGCQIVGTVSFDYSGCLLNNELND